MHLKDKQYIYNEVNPRVYSLFCYLAKDYKSLLEGIKVLQDYICLSENYPKKNNIFEEAQVWIDGRIDDKYYELDRELVREGTRQGCCMVCLYYFTHYTLEPLEQAVSEVFRRHFSHLGNIDVASALSEMRDFGNIMKFTGRFYDKLMKVFHEAIADTQCKNTNCFALIDKDETSNLY